MGYGIVEAQRLFYQEACCCRGNHWEPLRTNLFASWTALLFRPSTLSTKMPTNGLMIPWKVYSGRGIHFIPMLALLKRTISRYASAIPIASRAIFFQEVLIRHIPIHSKPHNTKPAIMYKRETINYVKGEQIMTETFGHSKDLITLYLSLKYSPTITYTLLRLAGTRVNIRLFL